MSEGSEYLNHFIVQTADLEMFEYELSLYSQTYVLLAFCGGLYFLSSMFHLT
jgi:hypothetical protein